MTSPVKKSLFRYWLFLTLYNAVVSWLELGGYCVPHVPGSGEVF